MTNNNESKWRDFDFKATVKHAHENEGLQHFGSSNDEASDAELWAFGAEYQYNLMSDALNELRTQLAAAKDELDNNAKIANEALDNLAAAEAQITKLTEEISKMQKLHNEDNLTFREITKKHKELTEENARLTKIIAKELSENDEFECEFVLVNILKLEK